MSCPTEDELFSWGSFPPLVELSQQRRMEIEVHYKVCKSCQKKLEEVHEEEERLGREEDREKEIRDQILDYQEDLEKRNPPIMIKLPS